MRPEVAAGLLAGIPGWQAARAIPLEGGLSNRTWIIDDGGRRAVLKVGSTRADAPIADRRIEAAAQRVAAAVDLAPRVLHADRCVLLSEYAGDATLSRADLRREETLVALAGALRRLHALPRSGRVFDAPAAARRYLALIGEAGGSVARRCLSIVDASRLPRALTFCHNDLVADNILSGPPLRFVDWEYASDNDPLFDLATLVAHHDLSAGLADCLLDAYFEGDGRRWRRRLGRQQRLYDALHWLWLKARSPASPALAGLESRF